MTSGNCSPDIIETVTYGDVVIGVAVTHDSDVLCTEREDGVDDVFSFKYEVLCDENITGNGEAVIHEVDSSDPCKPAVTFLHAAGCRAGSETDAEEVANAIE